MKSLLENPDYMESLLTRVSVMTANRCYENAGVIKKTITLSEIKKLHGRPLAAEARMSAKINWQPIGKGGRTSGVYCLRADFDRFLFKREFDFLKK